MRYILLVHHSEESWGRMSETEQNRLRTESVALTHQINARGQYLDASPLQPSSVTTCVRVREGKRIVIDGPFAETREQLGGYFLIDAKNLDEAIEIAGRIPGGRIGTVEIRPLFELPGLPTKEEVDAARGAKKIGVS